MDRTQQEPMETMNGSQKPQTSGFEHAEMVKNFFSLLLENHMNKWEVQLKLMHKRWYNTFGIGFN